MNSNLTTGLKIDRDLSTIDNALNELGMLSTVAHSRKEFIEEGENFLGKLNNLNMNGEKAGPSSIKSFDSAMKLVDSESLKRSVREKENSSLGDFHILTMNSQFITSFNSGYSYPFTELREKPKRKIFKCSNMFRKKRCRSHPYDIKYDAKAIGKNDKKEDNSFIDFPNSCDANAIRLRTASLSSSSKKIALEKHRENLNNTGMQRSRSMEDLQGSDAVEKTKDIDTVSRGIQQLHMEDCSTT